MGDLWGSFPKWVHIKVLEAIDLAPQHQYLMLTKSPGFYPYLLPDNVWTGLTVESYDKEERMGDLWKTVHPLANIWLSCEPMLGPIDQWIVDEGDWIEWVVVGAQTGAGAQFPEKKWLDALVKACKEESVPIYMKKSLSQVWGDNLIQQWPVGLQQHRPAIEKGRGLWVPMKAEKEVRG